MCTGYDNEEDRIKLLNAGAHAILSKPVTIKSI